MRRLSRAVAVVAAALALPVVTAATPAAAAGPTGCAGFPSIPDTYICIVQNTPENAIPTVTTTPVAVTVPAFCYIAGCTADTTVNVPVPNVKPGSGVVLVLSYKGTQYPIGVGTLPVDPTPYVNEVLLLADQIADFARDYVTYVRYCVKYPSYCIYIY